MPREHEMQKLFKDTLHVVWVFLLLTRWSMRYAESAWPWRPKPGQCWSTMCWDLSCASNGVEDWDNKNGPSQQRILIPDCHELYVWFAKVCWWCVAIPFYLVELLQGKFLLALALIWWAFGRQWLVITMITPVHARHTAFYIISCLIYASAGCLLMLTVHGILVKLWIGRACQ